MPKGNGTVHSHDQGVQMNEPFRKAYTIALAISIHHFPEKVKYYKRLQLKLFTRLHAKEILSFCCCFSSNSARMQEFFVFASLTAVVQSFPPPKYTQTVIICLYRHHLIKRIAERVRDFSRMRSREHDGVRYFHSKTVMCLPSRSQTLPMK